VVLGLLSLLFPVIATLSENLGYLYLCQALLSAGLLAGFWLLADSALGILMLAGGCLFFYYQTLAFIYSSIAVMTDKIRLQVHLSNLLVLSVLPAVCLKYLFLENPIAKHQDMMKAMTYLEGFGQVCLIFSNPKLLEKLCSAYMINRTTASKQK